MPKGPDAHALMISLCKLLDDYGFFTVSDVAELIDSPLPGNPKYGWTDVAEIEIFHNRNQTHVRFPEPVEVG